MNTKSKFLAATGLIAMGLSAGAVAHDAQAKEGMEKCYGVAKAGKNDCGSSDGAHACAGAAAKDSSTVDWVYLPEGTCDKLAGGTKG